MKFDIYGRYTLDIERSNDSWIVPRIEDGKRRLDSDIVIPATAPENDLITYLEDLLHESAQPGPAYYDHKEARKLR